MIAERSHRHWLALALMAGALAVGALSLGGRAWAGDARNQTLPYGEVNWDRGYIRVSAVGLPPFAVTSGAPADPEGARKNAVSAAQRRLLGVVLDLEVSNGKLRDAVAARPELKERLRQMISAAGVKGKTFSDGSVEVTLTLGLEGAGSLKALLHEL